MRIAVIALLALAAHYSLTSLAPAGPGKGTVMWPFAADSLPVMPFFGHPQDGLTAVLSGIAGLAFLAPAFYLLSGRLLQPGLIVPVVLLGAVASVFLYLGYFTPRSLLPLLLDGLLVWGMLSQNWAGLREG